MTVKKKPGTKVILNLPSFILKKVDKELRRIRKQAPRSKPTRANICLSFIENSVLLISETEAEKSAAHEIFLEQSKAIRMEATEYANIGENMKASSLYLLAAAKELEALAILGTRNENIIKSTLIQAIQLIKRGTGYNHLPSVPINEHNVSKFH